MQGVFSSTLLQSTSESSVVDFPRTSDTVVVSMHSENPREYLQQPPDVSLPHWVYSYILNRYYAYSHGYDFVFFQLQNKQQPPEYNEDIAKMQGVPPERLNPSGMTSCHHATEGWLNPTWCRIPCPAEMIEHGYKMVLLLDSDAYIRDSTVSIASFLQKTSNKVIYGTASETAHILFPTNYPWERKPNQLNGGMIFVRNSEAAKRVLQYWWNSRPQHWGHPRTQNAWRAIEATPSVKDHYAILNVTTMHMPGEKDGYQKDASSWMLHYAGADHLKKTLVEVGKREWLDRYHNTVQLHGCAHTILEYNSTTAPKWLYCGKVPCH